MHACSSGVKLVCSSEPTLTLTLILTLTLPLTLTLTLALPLTLPLPLPLTLTPPLTPPLTLTRYKGLKVRAERKMRECSEAKEVLVKQMGC